MKNFYFLAALGFAIGVVGAGAVWVMSKSEQALPKIGHRTDRVTEAEYVETKIPCRALIYDRFGDDILNAQSLDAWRKDGYIVVEMQVSFTESSYDWRLCVFNPDSPQETILLKEKDRPYWYDPDSERVGF